MLALTIGFTCILVIWFSQSFAYTRARRRETEASSEALVKVLPDIMLRIGHDGTLLESVARADHPIPAASAVNEALLRNLRSETSGIWPFEYPIVAFGPLLGGGVGLMPGMRKSGLCWFATSPSV